MAKLQKNFIPIQLILWLLFAGLIVSIGYFTERTDFYFFISQYLAAFFIFYLIWLKLGQYNFKSILFGVIILRLLLIFALPELSNDFYRFIWDGEIMTKGINPFAYTPNELISHIGFMDSAYMRELYHGMGELSQRHYSCYPVLNQFLFLIPTLFTDSVVTNVILLKIIVILADIGAVFFALKIAKILKIETNKIWLYFLNPFIILEFSGNLHFEGVMIFFLLGAVYFVLKQNWWMGGVMLGLAIQVKLIPLMLLPFFFKKLGFKNSVGFTAMTLFVTLAIGAILLNESYMANMLASVNEYFVSFEFNASVFYIIREIGFQTHGYDTVRTVGPFLSKMAAVLILLLAVFRAYRNDLDLLKGIMFAFLIYYTFATTVHPWYIALILIFSVFTTYKFGLVWSLVAMLSYFAYGNADFNESPILLIAEYVLVFGVLAFEIYKYWDKEAIGLQLKTFFKQ